MKNKENTDKIIIMVAQHKHDKKNNKNNSSNNYIL